MLLNNQWITGEIKEKKIPGGKWKWKQKNLKSMGGSKSSSKREIYSVASLSQETRKIHNEQHNLKTKETRKRKTNKIQK